MQPTTPRQLVNAVTVYRGRMAVPIARLTCSRKFDPDAVRIDDSHRSGGNAALDAPFTQDLRYCCGVEVLDGNPDAIHAEAGGSSGIRRDRNQLKN